MGKKKDKELATCNPVDRWVPATLRNTTLGNLMEDPDIEFRGGKGFFTMQRDFEDRRVTVRVDRKTNLLEMTESSYDNSSSREDRDDLIMKLVGEGRTQQEVADIVGLRQSRVSEIVRVINV